MDAVTAIAQPVNEPVRSYIPGSPERHSLRAKLSQVCADPTEICHIIGGQHRRGDGPVVDVVLPHRHGAVLGSFAQATARNAQDAADAATNAARGWAELSFEDRAAVFLRAADLLAGPWRERLLAATMLGQSKTIYQAEIDAACELIDFWRFNVRFARQILADQPISSPGVRNVVDYRPWRASSTRSPRSTSRPSPATCRPRPRCWATRWCGNPRPPSPTPLIGR